MKKEKTKEAYFYGLGRRKRSIARVRLYPGKGQSKVNDKPIEEYFKDIPKESYLKPISLSELTGKYYTTGRVVGGGIFGQVGAFTLGLSRAILKLDSDKYRKALKAAGLLMRDPRERERRKFGLAQGARARKQSPKR